MTIESKDVILDALIGLFNQQNKSNQWDAAYCTSIAIAEHYENRARAIRENVTQQLQIGVVNRARYAAESMDKAVESKSRKKKSAQ